jgi:type II secretion system protein J
VKTGGGHSKSRGFTLIELVVSVALMSIILGVGYACLSAGIASRKLVDARSDTVQQARIALALLSADLRAACPLSEDLHFLGMRRSLGEVQADNLDFATHNYSPRGPQQGDFCEVSYFLDQDRESGQFSLWRRRDPYPDPEPLAGGTREEIARGLQGLRFEYYDGFEWYSEWGDPDSRRPGSGTSTFGFNSSGLPEAVRITLVFAADPATNGRRPAAATAADPPLVFQTVVRLNLAAAASVDGTGQSADESGANAAPQTVPATGAGGSD